MINFENGKTPLSAENFNKLQNDLLGENGFDLSQRNIVKKFVKYANGEYEEYGNISNINIPVVNGTIIQINLSEEQKDTNYTVVVTLSNAVAYWASVAVLIGTKTTKSFDLHLYDNANVDISNISVNYIVRGQYKS